MNIASSIVTWLTWGVRLFVFGMYAFFPNAFTTVCSVGYCYRYANSAEALILLRILFFIWFIASLFILIWRHMELNKGKKIAVGIMTLLFVSAPGGIMTLCIPRSSMDSYY